jgi:hypothetical protein
MDMYLHMFEDLNRGAGPSNDRAQVLDWIRQHLKSLV